MLINEIDIHYVKIPLSLRKFSFSRPSYFEPSWIPGFKQTEMRFYLLRLGTDSGHEGFSAMPAMGSERFGLGDLIGPYLLGMNPLDLKGVGQRIQELSYVGLRNGWMEAAFYDLAGKIKKEPLWKMLGGSGGSVYPYASTGSTHRHNPSVAREIVKDRIDRGFRGVKLRVKDDRIAPMVEYVAAARDEAGRNFKIMVDANQGWPVDIVDDTPRWTPEFALEFARSIEKYGVYWLEEPLNRGDFEGLARLRKGTRTPIAGGEMNSSWNEFKSLLAKGCLDVYQPDAMLVGGTYEGGISLVYWLIKEIERLNKKSKNKLKFSPHTWTTGLGYVVGLHLVGLLPEKERSLLEYPLEGNWNPSVWGAFIKNLPVPGREGKIDIPEEPGLGIEIDMDIIRKFGRRVYHGTKSSISRHILLDRGLSMALELKKKKEKRILENQKIDFQIPPSLFM